MNWDAIGAVAELAGALAVVASLIYVGFQLKQNTAAVRGERYHSISSDMVAIYSSWADSEHIPNLILRFIDRQARIDDFEADDLIRVRLLFHLTFRLVEDIFRQVQEGNLPASALEQFGANSWLSAPIAHDLWPRIKANYADDFVEYVELRYHYNENSDFSDNET